MLRVEADLLLGPNSSSEMDSETDDQSYSPTEVYAQTWQGYITHIMHMLYCIACFYIIYTILNVISLVDTSYMQLPSAQFLSI